MAFFSNEPSLNPAEVYSFYDVRCSKRTKIDKKRPGWPFLNKRTKIIQFVHPGCFKNERNEFKRTQTPIIMILTAITPVGIQIVVHRRNDL